MKEKVIISRERLHELEAIERLVLNGESDRVIIGHWDTTWDRYLRCLQYIGKDIPSELKDNEALINRQISEIADLKKELRKSKKRWWKQ